MAESRADKMLRVRSLKMRAVAIAPSGAESYAGGEQGSQRANGPSCETTQTQPKGGNDQEHIGNRSG